MLSLKPILPPVSLMPQWMSSYFSLALSVRVDFAVLFFALTSIEATKMNEFFKRYHIL